MFPIKPIDTSLRSLQQASALEKVQRKLFCGRTSLDAFAETAEVFDATAL